MTTTQTAETFGATAHNLKVEQEALAEWATQPDRFSAHIVGDELHAWLGRKIGKVIWTQRTRTGFGRGWVTDYRIKGDNGAMYFGRKGDNQDLINLRKSRK